LKFKYLNKFATKEELRTAIKNEESARDHLVHSVYEELLTRIELMSKDTSTINNRGGDIDTVLLKELLSSRPTLAEIRTSPEIQLWIAEILEREIRNSLDIGAIRSIVKSIVEEELAHIKHTTTTHTVKGGTGLTIDEVAEMITNAIEIYDADKIGKADYALQSAGSAIVYSRTSPSYSRRSGFFDWLLLKGYASTPNLILQPDNSIGNCWAFPGSNGNVTVKLAMPIIPTEFTLDHISERIAYHWDSAPKDFQVWGLRSEGDYNAVLLGRFTYEKGKATSQTKKSSFFHKEPFQYLTLEILSNYGHEDYTCVYRFRAHGIPTPIQ